ncbi:MAG: FISUMP domain-containing protein [Bacteroidales bacterium]|nr:FISUMP domain-containing protein [Bacteroidales bacterium]
MTFKRNKGGSNHTGGLLNIITTLIISLSPVFLSAQGEFNKWYFGTLAAIDFNMVPPTALMNSAMNAMGATVSISDSMGHLLFYSDGRKVYNRIHEPMSNGNGLNGSIGTFQHVFAIKKPGEDSIYYLFTIKAEGIPMQFGLYYSLININLNGGLGDVIPGYKNIPVIGAEDSRDMIHGTRHHNNRDVWIVVRKNSSSQYASFLISSSGISTPPVLSPCFLPGTSDDNQGQMKISQDGTKLVAQGLNPPSQPMAELCNFNSQTGAITPLFLFRPVEGTTPLNPDFFEFSPSSRLLYVTSVLPSLVSAVNQYNLANTDSAHFMQSQLLVGTHPFGNALQLGSDGKIYQGIQTKDSLNVINNPNIPGTGCNFQSNAVSLNGKTCHQGFPQFLQFYKAYIHFTGECQFDSIHFSGDIWPPADTIRWNFGDPTSGAANVSTQETTFHLFSSPGVYTVELYVRHNDNRTDTSWRTITIFPSPQPVLGSDRTICSGNTVMFDAGFCSGCSYEWKNIGSGLIVGTDQTFTTGAADTYCVNVTNGNGCTGKDTVQLITTPVPQINNPQLTKSICSGEGVNIMLSSNVPGTMFHWTASLTSGNISGFSADSGLVINQILTDNIPTPGSVTYQVTPKIGSCYGSPVDFLVTVNPGDSAKVTISSSTNSICSGTMVTYTATPTNPGTTPVYQWKINGVNSGSNSSMFSYAPSNGDQLQCILTSSILVCISNNPALSNTITMTVLPLLPVSVSVSASSNPFCIGTSVTFTASPVNGGSTPGCQWKVNANNVNNANNAVFIYSPLPGDLVSCVMTSSLDCVTANPATSAAIAMIALNAPDVTFSPCFDTITTTGAKPFKLKGGIPLGGTYSGAGVNSLTSVFTPSSAGIGLKTILYAYTNVSSCSADKTKTILVLPNPPFTCENNLTDIRDGKSYATVQIGTQCWMAANLNYGSTVPSFQVQYDNCISEKYCYNDLAGNCNKYGGLYQWDELMRYDNAAAGQGECPPGWHVPTESEWTTLFGFYSGYALAGKPLQDFTNVFKAFRSGVTYWNSGGSFIDFATIFWSSTSWGQLKALSYGMNSYNYSVSWYPASRANAFAVRCLRD